MEEEKGALDETRREERACGESLLPSGITRRGEVSLEDDSRSLSLTATLISPRFSKPKKKKKEKEKKKKEKVSDN